MVMREVRKRLERSVTRTRPSVWSNSRISRRRSSLSMEISTSQPKYFVLFRKDIFCYVSTLPYFAASDKRAGGIYNIPHSHDRSSRTHSASERIIVNHFKNFVANERFGMVLKNSRPNGSGLV